MEKLLESFSTDLMGTTSIRLSAQVKLSVREQNDSKTLSKEEMPSVEECEDESLETKSYATSQK